MLVKVLTSLVYGFLVFSKPTFFIESLVGYISILSDFQMVCH
jgi:hypothetical protein